MRTLSVVAMVLLAGCPIYPSRPDPPKAPKTPVPFTELNSPFDDFNSADMSPYWLHHLVFSTNRGSEGKHFDLYQAQLGFRTPLPRAHEPTPFVPALMSDRDERGPIAYEPWEWTNTWSGDAQLWFALASDREGGVGGLDLYARPCAHYQWHREGPCAEATELPPLAALNSPADDAYLSKPFAARSVLFASNREGSRGMDIYSARWDEGKTLVDAPASIELVAGLSSDAEDTAPYVFRVLQHPDEAEMVFVSSRAGGLGEHDIYCARFAKGKWSAPKSLGPTFNSARDEYRPIIIQVNTTRFLIFSSTREGGQGGYDLYIAGYPGCR